MKLSKIVDKVKKYLEKDNLKVSQEKKLLNIIEELENKKSKIKDELKNIDKDNIKKRVELEKKYNAVSKVLKKEPFYTLERTLLLLIKNPIIPKMIAGKIQPNPSLPKEYFP